MSNESANERVFSIPVQTFKKKVPLKHSWVVKIKALDQLGEEKHEWRLETSYTEFQDMSYLNFIVSTMDKKKKYDKLYYRVDIYESGESSMVIIKYIDGLTIDSYEFQHIYNIGSTMSESQGNDVVANGVIISFTIGSCYLNECKSFIRQKKMLDEDTLTDMVIKTKEQQFPCHKFVLAAESEYFKTMFLTDMREKNTNSVDWTDVFAASVVKDLLHFFYTGQESLNLKDHPFEMLEAADLCMLPKLESMCFESLGKTIGVENAARVLQAAEVYESEELKEIAIKFVLANWPQVSATDGFRKLKRDIRSRVLPSVFELVYELYYANK